MSSFWGFVDRDSAADGFRRAFRVSDASSMRISIDRGLTTQRWLSRLLVFFLVLSPGIDAQQTTPPQTKPMAPLPIVQNLKVLPLAGNDGSNVLDSHTVA